MHGQTKNTNIVLLLHSILFLDCKQYGGITIWAADPEIGIGSDWGKYNDTDGWHNEWDHWRKRYHAYNEIKAINIKLNVEAK